jgi:hypothetical protein
MFTAVGGSNCYSLSNGRELSMTRRGLLAATAVVLLSFTAIYGKRVNAQTEASNGGQQPKLLVENVRTSIVQAIKAQDAAVEASISQNIFLISRINSDLNKSSHSARDSEASRIASIVSRTISGKAEFKNIHTIRVQYVDRSQSGVLRKAVDIIDFRKAPGGGFVLHTT